MKMPRNISGAELAAALARVGYLVTRQKGSHMRLTTQQSGVHHITIPNHNSIKIGTLSRVLRDVADHLGMEREDLIDVLFQS